MNLEMSNPWTVSGCSTTESIGELLDSINFGRAAVKDTITYLVSLANYM